MTLHCRPLLLAIALCTSSVVSQANTLSQIYLLALENDATLKRAEATYRANIEVKKQALSAMLPQLNAEAYYRDIEKDVAGQSIDSQTTLPVPSTNKTDTTSEGYEVSLSQPLFDLPAWFSYKSGKQLTQQAQAQLAFEQQSLIVRVATAYFNVLRALDNLEASKAEERATKRQLEQTQQRFDVGLIAITDVHEAKAVYDSTVVQRLVDEGNLGTSYEALTVLTGQAHNNLWLLNKDFPVTDADPIDRDQWVQFALKHNYQLKAAIHAVDSARQTATAKKMEHAPKLSGFISYTDDNTSGTTTTFPASSFSNIPPNTDTETQTFGLKLTVPLYSGGRISSQRRQAYEQYNAALQQKIETQRSVVQNTRASHITVTTDVQRVKARSQAIVSTSSALDATQAGYEVGTRNIVDVLEAQRRLYNSIRDYANSRYDYVIDMLNLKQAAGTLSPQDIEQINKWLVQAGTPAANPYQHYLNR